MRFRGILFDKDGTLIEANGVWAPLYRSVLMRMKNITEADADQLLAMAGYDVENDRVIGGTVIAGGTTAQLVELWWPESSSEQRRSIVLAIDANDKRSQELTVTPIVELPPLLAALRQAGYRLGIATNDSAVSAKRHMEQIGIMEFLDAIICADTVSVPKPSGDMIREFARVTGMPQDEIIMVGDNHHDMEEAVNGGAGYRVAVLSGNSSRQELAHLADVTLKHVGELPQHLESLRVL
jgi:phosphoglycolate phosphatase